MEGPGGGSFGRGHQQQQAQASPTPSPEQVLAGFNKLRQEQRGLAGKGAELEQEVAEHGLVIDTLAEVDPDRRCFRMVGGVLVERTVREVLPALESNKQQVGCPVDGDCPVTEAPRILMAARGGHEKTLGLECSRTADLKLYAVILAKVRPGLLSLSLGSSCYW
ncbi:prefoldin subunit 2, partial [Chiloscyllium plagiosum]|uniref:prefoldin subunit 2 n=1 Tax=Chiloscyllium plagiosum TaxID=36176 RepID=UPI001CB8557A